MTGMNPLDWYGGAFLGLYAILFVGALIAGAAIAYSRRPDGHSLPVGDEDEMAVLAGGPNRLTETVITRMLSQGRATIEKGRVTIARSAPGASPVEREIALLSSPVKWRTIRHRISTFATHIDEKLVRSGLLMERGEARWLGLYAAIPLVVLIGFGLAKVQVGLARERPVGFLIVFLIVTAVAALIRVLGTSRLTKAGIATIKAAQERSQRLKRAPTNDEAGTAVALFGTAVLVGSPLADLHKLRQGSGGDGSGGDGGGGGGGGGGGCGGCGGG